MAAASRRVQRVYSTAKVMRVVAMDRTIVAARIATMAHGGKCAGSATGGGSGGTGVKEGVGGAGGAHAAGARPMAAARQTARPPGPAGVRGMRGGCARAGWRFMGVAPWLPRRMLLWMVRCVVRTDTAARGGRNCLGIGLDNVLEQGWFWW